MIATALTPDIPRIATSCELRKRRRSIDGAGRAERSSSAEG
jgi:hypothetical protein